MLTSKEVKQNPPCGLLGRFFIQHLEDHESGEFDSEVKADKPLIEYFYDDLEAITLKKTISRLQGKLTTLRHNHAVDLNRLQIDVTETQAALKRSLIREQELLRTIGKFEAEKTSVEYKRLDGFSNFQLAIELKNRLA